MDAKWILLYVSAGIFLTVCTISLLTDIKSTSTIKWYRKYNVVGNIQRELKINRVAKKVFDVSWSLLFATFVIMFFRVTEDRVIYSATGLLASTLPIIASAIYCVAKTSNDTSKKNLEKNTTDTQEIRQPSRTVVAVLYTSTILWCTFLILFFLSGFFKF